MESIMVLRVLVLILFLTFPEEFSIIRIYSCKNIDMLLHKIFLKTDLELRENLFYRESFDGIKIAVFLVDTRWILRFI